jgi:hypothetical protein
MVSVASQGVCWDTMSILHEGVQILVHFQKIT